MKYSCPNCRVNLKRGMPHCPGCALPLCWLPDRGGKIPIADQYRLERERSGD